MPDNVATFDPSTLASASSDEKAQFATAMQRAGFSQEAIEAKLGTPTVPSGEVAKPNFKVPMGNDGLTPEQHEAALKNLEKFWTGQPETLRGEPAIPSAPVFDPTLDAPASPQSYRIHYDPSTLVGLSPSDVALMDNQAKTAFHAAGVPAINAQGLMDAISKTTAQFKGLDNKQIELMVARETSTLNHMTTLDKPETHRLVEKVQALLGPEFCAACNEKWPSTVRQVFSLSLT